MPFASDPSRVVVVLGFALVLLAMSQLRWRFIEDRRSGRHFYWATSCAGLPMIALGLGLGTGNWPKAILCIAVLTAFLVAFAYLCTPYLKIGDRIYAFTIPNQQPDPSADGSGRTTPPPAADSYSGTVSARNLWWFIAIGACCLTTWIHFIGFAAQVWTAVAISVAVSVVIGLRDARDGFAVARGQRIPFVIATVASLILFGGFPVAYLLAYAAGTRWPGQHGKHHRERGPLDTSAPSDFA